MSTGPGMQRMRGLSTAAAFDAPHPILYRAGTPLVAPTPPTTRLCTHNYSIAASPSKARREPSNNHGNTPRPTRRRLICLLIHFYTSCRVWICFDVLRCRKKEEKNKKSEEGFVSEKEMGKIEKVQIVEFQNCVRLSSAFEWKTPIWRREKCGASWC